MRADGRIDWTRGALYGVASAALFGLSAPLSKRLLPEIGPMLLAGLLYLGAGAGLTVVSLVRGRPWPQFKRNDCWRLALIALMGGFAGPTLLLVGLTRVSGVIGSLLLNLEAVFTMVIAVAFFRDRLAASEWMGALVIVSGAAVVSYRPGELKADWVGVLAVAGACLCWGFDNNLLQRVSSYDPVSVVQIKSLSAGTVSVLLALALGQRWAGSSIVPAALGVGFVCYGISIVFDVYALRYLGAAREAAVFATAPFIGALASVPLLGDRLTRTDAIGAGLMVIGVVIFRYRATQMTASIPVSR
jgi:drug/metabolite transporter (DMT)-like permease